MPKQVGIRLPKDGKEHLIRSFDKSLLPVVRLGGQMEMVDSPLGQQKVSVSALVQRVGGQAPISQRVLDAKAEMCFDVLAANEFGFDFCQGFGVFC
jgi:hypothetical protein